MRLVKMS